MAAVEKLVIDHLDLWTSAIKRKSTAGRGSSRKIELYGIKKLRELILDLAVRGLLVPQDPSEEPADELLKQIAIEKAELLKNGKIKADKPLPPIDDVEKPFSLPSGWLWERLPNISFIQEGPGIMAKDFRGEGIPLIRISGMHDTLVSLNGCNFLDEDMVAKKWNHFRLDGDDILLSSSASLGKVSKVGNDAIGAIAYTGLIRFKPYHPLFDDYLIRFFGSNEFARQIDESKKGAAIQHFGPTHLRWMVVPLPPLAEQYRIVAKVGALMALCDQLEQQTDANLSAHQTLVETLLNALTNAPDHARFATAWQRIAEHFDTLFTSEESIDQLKQTILQLAVTGKLVSQDPNDVPATELVKIIAVEKARLEETEGLRTSASANVRSEEHYFSTPNAWAWIRLGNLAKFIDYRGKTPEKIEAGVRLITAKNIRYGCIDINPEEFISSADYDTWMTRGFPREGDTLFTTEAPLGNAANITLREKFALAQRTICFQWHEPKIGQYMLLQILAKPFQDKLIDNATGMTAAGIKASKLKEIPVLLPPLREQHRIVSKVGELMALCDQLTSRLSDAQTTHLHLADALTGTALARAC